MGIDVCEGVSSAIALGLLEYDELIRGCIKEKTFDK